MKSGIKLRAKTKSSINLKKTLFILVLGGGIFSLLLYFGLVFYGFIGNPNKVIASQVTGYSLYALITVDKSKVSGGNDLINFPMLVMLENQDLKTTNNGGSIENINGYDIIFSDENDTQLEHQVESYDPFTGRYIAWVKIPILKASVNTSIKLFYGNSNILNDPSTTNIWGSDYHAVWHMDQVEELIDVTANSRKGTEYGNINSSNLVSGKIGNGINFDGIDDYYKIDGYKGVTQQNQRTISFWFKGASSGYDHRFISWGKNQSGKKYDVRINGSNNAFRVENASGQKYGVTSVTDDNWHFLTVVLPAVSSPNVQDHLLYVDGVLETSTGGGAQSLNTSNVGEDVLVGKSNWHCCFTKGIMDEVRIIEKELSADWILTEFGNQNSPNSFYAVTFGLSTTVLPIELSSFEVKLVENTAQLNWTTESEVNNDYFTIEKSKDLESYEWVGEIPGAGNNNGRLHYSFNDENVYNGITYYRLKQTDFDGQYEYSFPQALRNNQEFNSLAIKKISPNPFLDQFEIEIKSKQSGIAQLILRSLNGKEINSYSFEINEGTTLYTYREGSSLSSATYVVNIVFDEQVVNHVVFKR